LFAISFIFNDISPVAFHTICFIYTSQSSLNWHLLCSVIALFFTLGLASLFHLLKYAYSTYSTMHHLSIIIMNSHYKKSWPFWLKISVKKIPHMVLCPHVQLDQSAILDKLFWNLTVLIKYFWLVFLLNHHDHNIFGQQ